MLSSLRRQALAIAALAAVAYVNTLAGGFVYDDLAVVVANPWIRDFRHLGDIFSSGAWSFAGMESYYYRPLWHLIYLIDYRLFALQPWGYHLVNIVLHVLVSVAVLMVVAKLLSAEAGGKEAGGRRIDHGGRAVRSRGIDRDGGDGEAAPPRGASTAGVGAASGAAIFAAALFAVHPVHSEVVAWVSGVPDLCAALFFLLALNCYLSCRAQADGGAASVRRYCLSLLFFFLALLGKEVAIALPPLLVALELGRAGEREERALPARLRPLLGYFAVVAVYLAMRYVAISALPPMRHGELSAWQYAINVFPLFAAYLGKLVAPLDLSVAYTFKPATSLGDPRLWVSLPVALGFLASLWAARKASDTAFTGLLLLAATLAPALYIPALGEHPFSERYLYLPSAGFTIVVAALADRLIRAIEARERLARARRMLLLAGAATVLVFCAATVSRNRVWADELSLWTDAAAKAPDSAVAHGNLGMALRERGQEDAAMREFATAAALDPEMYKAQYNLGVGYMAAGDSESAAASFATALRLRPTYNEARVALGDAYARSGRFEQALAQYRQALQSDPANAEIHSALGVALAQAGRAQEGLQELHEAIRLAPGLVAAYNNCGVIYAAMGKKYEAAGYFRKALALDPGNAEIGANLANALR